MMSDEQQQVHVALVPETWSVKEVVADLKADLIGHLDKQDVTLSDISHKVEKMTKHRGAEARRRGDQKLFTYLLNPFIKTGRLKLTRKPSFLLVNFR